MSAAMSAPRPAVRVDVISLAENDLPEIAIFVASQSGQHQETVESHLRSFLLQNPARKPEQPLGFGLRSHDRLVGCILCSPQAFRRGAQRIDFMGSSSFYIHEAFRGQGARLFLRYSRIPAPLFGTSANAEASTLWKAIGATPIPHSEGELFGVLHWPPVAEEFARRKHKNRLLTHVAGSFISNLAAPFLPLKMNLHPSASLRVLSSAEQVDELLQQSFPHENIFHRGLSPKITALRDLPYIRWRYFSGNDPTAAVFAFRSHASDREIVVTVNRRKRGYRGQIETLNLLDVYPEADFEEWLAIVGALIKHYRRQVHAIVLRSQSPEHRKSLRDLGFLWRAFDAPTGWFLDKAKCLPTQEWYPVPADGDGLI